MKRLYLLFFVAVLATSPAAGQAIPVEIPDTPGESPADQKRERLEERYNSLFARAYMTTSVGASPLLHRQGAIFDTFIEVGIQVAKDFSVFLLGGPRIAPEMQDDLRRSESPSAGWAGALGAEFNLGSTDDWRLSVATGTWAGDIDIFFAELSPRYIYPINHYWNLMLGGKATVATFSEGRAFVFVGPSVGIRRSFGQRAHLN